MNPSAPKIWLFRNFRKVYDLWHTKLWTKLNDLQHFNRFMPFWNINWGISAASCKHVFIHRFQADSFHKFDWGIVKSMLKFFCSLYLILWRLYCVFVEAIQSLTSYFVTPNSSWGWVGLWQYLSRRIVNWWLFYLLFFFLFIPKKKSAEDQLM